MNNDAVAHEDVSHKRDGLGLIGYIVMALLAVVALAVSVGMFTMGILSVLGINPLNL